MPPIKYPTWDVKQSPTPSETLYICDKCGKAVWAYHGLIMYCYCSRTKKGGHPRMRVATNDETKIGKSKIKFVI